MVHKISTTLHIDKSISRAEDFDVASDCETGLCQGTPKITYKLWSTHSEQSVYVSQHRNIFELPVKLQIAIPWHHTFKKEFYMLLAGIKKPL